MKYIFQIKVKDGFVEQDYVDAWKNGSAIIQKEKGAQGTILYRKIDEPGTLIAIATWESKELRDQALERLSHLPAEIKEVIDKHEKFSERNSLGNFEEIARVDSN